MVGQPGTRERRTLRDVRFARFAIATVGALATFFVVGAASAATSTRNVPNGGTVAVPRASAPQAGTSNGRLEIDSTLQQADPIRRGATVTRGNTRVDRHGKKGKKGKGTNPDLGQSFDGLNFFDQRFANGGNQFSGEPPDQGLCVGNGKVVEVVNDVYQVFDTQGKALTNPIDVNSLFGYAPAIVRSGPNAGQFGPDVFDVSCLFDQQTGRFFVVASTLDRVGTTSLLAGTSHIDVAVAGDPTSAYTIYRIPTTSDAQCTLDGTNPGPCFPDFPHIGADANGFYITTNVFDFFGPNFDGVNIYALPKALLASTPASVPVTLTSTNGLGPTADGSTGFSVIPAVTPDEQFAGSGGGTEYFVSSRAVFTNDGTSTSLVVWTLSNTGSLTSATPNLRLSASVVNTDQYGVPAPPTQKAGDTPLATCIGSTTLIPALGVPCWTRLGLGFSGPVHVTENVLDGNDSRVGGVAYANGKLWATLGSAASDSTGQPADGIAWFVMKPDTPSPNLINQGLLVKDGTNLTYPSIAATKNGRAAMGFTIVGPSDYPSAGFVGLNAKDGTGDVQYAAHGAGPQDGFTEYAPFFADGSPRPRWGDYGAAVADGKSIWVASEYIGQTCTFSQYLLASPTNKAAFGTCGDTRAALGNWDTRISQLVP
jgi:hypothetical protein